ncbi:porin [Thorsellia kenyensis]|uniref:Porin n=1 Tax=Thorsellia kenyensis TaxID=1549888 RepID=A0ABV6C9T6_9GAMM
MNRKVLAVAITALLAANAANAAEIYNKDGNKIELKGKVEAQYTIRGDSDRYVRDGNNNPVFFAKEEHANEDETIARLGFHGETQINSELTGYGVFEQQFTPDNRSGNGDDTDETRLAYAGLKYGNLGSLDFGRNNGIVKYVHDFTDNAAVFGGDGFGGGTDRFMTGRASSVATYSVHDAYGYVDGLNMYVQYQAKHNEVGTDADGFITGGLKESNGDGIAFTTTYEHEIGLGAAVTYANSDRLESQRFLGINVIDPATNTTSFIGTGSDGNNAEFWAIAAKYDANNVYAAISWAESNNLHLNGDETEFYKKTRGLEAVANYTFDFGLTPSIVYNQLRARDIKDNGIYTDANNRVSDAYVTKYVGIGAEYSFNKNMDMAVGYKFNLIDDEAEYTNYAGIAADDQFTARLTYSF